MGFNPFIGGGASEDKVARAEIAAIKDGETLDSFSDVENALANKADIADIPTVPITTIQKNGTNIMPVEGTVNIIVPTTAADVSALPDTTRYAASLSLTIDASTFVVTAQLKDQNNDNLGTAQTIDLPLESVVIGGSYNDTTKKVVLTLQNGNTVEFSVADLVAGLQSELSDTNKLNPAYIEYDSSHRAVSDAEKAAWNAKQEALSSEQLAAVNSGINITKVAQIVTNADNEAEDRSALVELIDAGPKNLIHFNYPDNFAGLTFTKNADGSVTVNGTVTSTAYFIADKISNVSPDTEMVLTGAPAGGYGKYAIVIETREPTQYFSDIGNGWSGKIGGTINEVKIVFVQGATIDNLTFKPMLCTAVDYAISQKFVPYRPSYQRLYEMVQALQAQLGNTTIKIITKTEYDSIPHDENTIYYVKDGDKVVQYLGDAKFGTGSSSGSSSLYGVANKSVNGNAEFSEIS